MAKTFVDPCSDKNTAISVDGTPVKLIIGEEKHVTYIHASVLRKSSGFFRAALKEQWAEGQEREVKLPEEELETVTTYFQWLYGDTVATKVANEDKQDAYVYLAKLYGLGERLLDSKFQNRIVDAFLVNSRELMNGERYSPIGKAVNIIYENTPKSSPARQLMVEYWYCQGGSKWVEESKVQLHHEFMEDMLSVLLSGRERPAVGGARYNALREGVPDAYYKHD